MRGPRIIGVGSKHVGSAVTKVLSPRAFNFLLRGDWAYQCCKQGSLAIVDTAVAKDGGHQRWGPFFGALLQVLALRPPLEGS
jgi:hypothetical protein